MLVACVVVGAQFAAFSTRQAVIASAFTGPSRVQVRARLRVVTNLAVGLGTAVAAVALTVDTIAAYRATIVLAGLLAIAAVLQARRLPATGAQRPTDAPDRSPLRDRTYVTATALNAIMATHMGLFAVGVPLWVTTATAAPPVVVAVLLVVNAVLVALLQVRAARGTDDVRVAGRFVRRAESRSPSRVGSTRSPRSVASWWPRWCCCWPPSSTPLVSSGTKGGAGGWPSSWPTPPPPARTRA